jgi:Kef-type K+ transport system membrane component KefB
LIELAIILGVAHYLGELMRRLKQPAVVGNILAGVLLGPSVLGHWFPRLELAIFPHDQNQANLLAATTWLGLLLLLFATGLETDINLIVRKGRTAFLVSAGGLLLPCISGFYLGKYLPDSLLVHPEQRLGFSLFLAVAMCISALPIVAYILRDLKAIRREVGQITLAAAMLDDTIGWILLAIVSGLVLSGKFDAMFAVRMVATAIGFLVLAYFVGRPLVKWAVTWTDDWTPGPSAQLTVLIVIGLLASSLTHWLGLESVLGIFVVGILAGMVPRLRSDTVHSLDLVVSSFLAPIYFGLAGLRVNLWSLLNWQMLLVLGLVIGIACVGKLIGVYAGAWSAGVAPWDRLAMSFGMNARGSMEIVVATVGFSMGVLTYQMYSVIVVMAVATAVVAGPAMRWALVKGDVGGSDAERLAALEAAEKSFLRRLQRVLLPEWSGAPVDADERILVALLSAGSALNTTDLYVEQRGDGGVPDYRGGNLGTRGYKSKTVKSADPAEAILAEAAKSYDLIVLRAHLGGSGGATDAVIRNAPCATMVVKAAGLARTTLKNVLVYTDGTKPSAAAVEVAAKLAGSAGARLAVLCTAEPHMAREMQRRAYESGRDAAQQIANGQAALARTLGANADAVVEEAERTEDGILGTAEARRCELIVLAGSVLPTTGRAYLGSLAENVLREARCTVVVLNA